MATRSSRTAALVVVLGVVASGVAGCGSKDAGPPGPTFPSPAADDLWNPCDPLSAALVSRLMGAQETRSVEAGGAAECRFSPATAGDPAVNANYSLLPGTLDDLIATFGDVTKKNGTKVSTPRVARADGARLIVHPGPNLAVSGFVKNGELVQALNIVAPAPYDRRVVVGGAIKLLRTMAAHADESGLTSTRPVTGSASPSGSPSPSGSGSPSGSPSGFGAPSSGSAPTAPATP